MGLEYGPDSLKIYEQLQWIARRKIRISKAILMHFASKAVNEIIDASIQKSKCEIIEKPLEDCIDEVNLELYLNKLAYSIEYHESLMIHKIRKCFDNNLEKLDQTIFLSSRESGQEAARTHSAKHLKQQDDLPSLAELYSALSQLCYNGLPQQKNHFASIRPFSEISIHHTRCPHTKAWNDAADMAFFMNEVQRSWIIGILDILAPNIKHKRPYAIAKGDSFGLDYFTLQDRFEHLHESFF